MLYQSIKNTRPVYKYKTGFNFFHQESPTWLGVLIFWEMVRKYVSNQALSILSFVFSCIWANLDEKLATSLVFMYGSSLYSELTGIDFCQTFWLQNKVFETIHKNYNGYYWLRKFHDHLQRLRKIFNQNYKLHYTDILKLYISVRK